MHVGVFLENLFSAQIGRSLPHARGGVSSCWGCRYKLRVSSPCTWGCFYVNWSGSSQLIVFPMHVGVFPICILKGYVKYRLPHARGGVSPAQKALLF